jgi:hypothetical protein
MKKIQLALSAIAAIGLSAFALSASATTVFSEDFEGYNTFLDQDPLFDPINAGIPKLSEGATEIWYGARFEDPDHGATTINENLAVQKFGGGSNNTHTGRTENDAGLLFKLDTTNLDSITLNFDWRTFSASTSDRFVVGYHIGSISGFGTCTGEGETGCFADLRTALPWYTSQTGTTLTGNWSQLLRDTKSNAWQSESFLLPDAVENQSEVWFTFWLDNGEGDFAKVDNINVTATVIPVPPAVWLFGTGLLGLVGVARRRKVA